MPAAERFVPTRSATAHEFGHRRARDNGRDIRFEIPGHDAERLRTVDDLGFD
jgi:hypothetical protein